MPERLPPGVYVEETSSGPPLIEGVDTGTAGMSGFAEQGPPTPQLVTSWDEYRDCFGDGVGAAQSFLPWAVKGFFDNGGERLYVMRVDDAAPPADALLDGLAALAEIDGIAILAVPDHVNAALLPDVADRQVLTHALVDQCERRRDRVALLSVETGQGDASAIMPPRDSSYAAFYAPWIRIGDAAGGDRLVPAVGHIAGIYARVDRERGVHKAPANEEVRGIVAADLDASRRPLEFTFGERDQDVLKPRGVNLIRDFRAAGRGIRVWGARTLSSDPAEWKYVSVRRQLIYLEQSIDKGTAWAVFETNGEPLWSRMRANVDDFLLRVWRSGGLQGSRPQEAWYVRCDRSTMTEEDIASGRLICEIGVATVRPAEFVILRIQQILAGGDDDDDD